MKLQLPQGFDPQALRADFPILARQVHGRPLVYLDNAATTQKPQPVLDCLQHYYSHFNANVHRGVHCLSEEATAAYEKARDRVKAFINAGQREEIVFVRGTTEAINLVAQAGFRPHLGPGDEILISVMEHHSNIVPWQLLCRQTGARLQAIPLLPHGELDLGAAEALLGPRTRLLALTHVSNALGTVNPVQDLVARAHAKGIPVLIDGAQAAPHLRIDVQQLGADFYAFSGHKVYGPTGIGVLYGRLALLEAMDPWQGGGEMITRVSLTDSEFQAPPHRFEAGTPHIAGAIGLGAAIDYLESAGLAAIGAYEQRLLGHATEAVLSIPGLRLVGTARHKTGILSFVMEQAHPHDIATVLDRFGVAVRAGHHCAMPLMSHYRIPGTVRASLGLYNTGDDIDRLVEGLHEVVRLFGRPAGGR